MNRILKITVLAVALCVVTSANAQQPQPNPMEAALKKMRETLRTTMVQLQTAEADKANLQAELDTTKTENEKKISDLTKQLEKLRKQSTEDQAASAKSINDLTSKVANAEQDLSRTKQTLAKWKDGYGKAAAIAQKKERERSVLAGKVVVLERRVADNEAKNAEMFKIGNEILDRYKGFGLGTALTAREPFTGITRVKLQNLMQNYEEKLVAQKIRPADYNNTLPEEKKDSGGKANEATPAADNAKPQAADKAKTKS